jgi:hypothetical protein
MAFLFNASRVRTSILKGYASGTLVGQFQRPAGSKILFTLATSGDDIKCSTAAEIVLNSTRDLRGVYCSLFQL